MNRRNFIKITTAATAGAALLPATARATANKLSNVQSMNFFTKPLHWMNYDQLAESVAKLGLDGFDLTVRPKGHVLPENVERDLPRVVKAAQAQGLKVEMIVTEITDAEDELAEKVLKTAAQHGVKQYRMGYLKYDLKKGIEASLSDISKTMGGLEKLNQSAGLTGSYQNHYAWQPGLFGCAIWDLHRVLKDVNPQWLACQYDVRHAIAECAGSWVLGMRLIAPWIKSICLKDFDFKGERKGRSCPRTQPAGKGEVPWKEYAGLLEDLNIKVPASIHIEWEYLSDEEKKLPYEERAKLAIGRIQEDCDFYKSVFSE